jgi:hypothetical protein
MVKSVAPPVVAAKKTRPHKTVADKKDVVAAKFVERKPAAPRKRSTSPKPVAVPAIGLEERHHLIAAAAYYIAERRGFHGASSHDDWLQAEREIDAMIAAGKFAA